MARIFRDCNEMIREMDRELKVSGITVPVKHYQNQPLQGEDRNTKELIGVNFIITHPDKGKKEMLDFVFKEESNKIEEYCQAEIADRLNRNGVNPGNSYKIRMDLWQKLMSRNEAGKFDYTYSERINWYTQLDHAINALVEDRHTRRAMVMVFFPEDSQKSMGCSTRIPCSISYQFLVRNNKLMVLYYIRSNDYFKHFAVDIWLTHALQAYVLEELKSRVGEKLRLGSLNYYAGSFHAYNQDLSNWVIY